MISYVYLLALLFFTITNGQEETYWTGGGGSSNNTFSDPANWSNGPPTETSIVRINETGCNGCTIVVDMPITIAELHMTANTSTGPYLNIKGVNLTVTGAFNLGSPSPTTYYNTYVMLYEGGIFEIGKDCVATIYYVGSYPISGRDATKNMFINRGSISFLGNGGVTAGSYATTYIGYGSSYPLWIISYGTWDVSTGEIELRFDNLPDMSIYGGSFTGATLRTTGTTYPTIRFSGTNVVLQEGTGGVLKRAAGSTPTFEGGVYFYSNYVQYYENYASTPPNTLIFNTSDATVSDALFYATNIVFLYDGWLNNCQVTDYSLVNSSSTVSGVRAHFIGSDNIIEDSVFAGVDTDFIVQVEHGATVTMNDYFALTGTVTLLNYGNWTYDSSSYLYFDEQATWVNLGLMQVINSASDFIYGTKFPGQTEYSDAGTLVNMGTIEFTNGGGLNFNQDTGTFLQCEHGILKFGYGFPEIGDDPGTVDFANVVLDGFIGFAFNEDADIPIKGTTIFNYVADADDQILSGSFIGTFDVVTKGPGILDSDRLVCFSVSGTSGYTKVYDLIDEKICPDKEYQKALPTLGSACSTLPQWIQDLEDTATCAAGDDCGINTGIPAGEPGSPANVNVVSLAFLISLVCLLLKF